MKLAIVVTEFPCVTETFIFRDVAEFLDRGHEVRLYHLSPFRSGALVHDFARPVVAVARTYPFLTGRSIGALARALRRRPGALLGLTATLLREYRREPVMLAKSLAFLPKSLAFAEEVAEWKPDHVHGEFAGHPATCAWIIGRMTGMPYSVSCRAHDIFITQAGLGVKLREAAFIRTISQHNVAFLRRHVPDIAGKEMVVIHSSVDVTKIRPCPPRNAETFHVLYVGSLQVRKGVDLLLHALSRASLGEWRCVVIGEGPERRRLVALAERLAISDRVSFRDAQPFDMVSAAYGEADVVVVPSTYGPRGRTEGIPNVVIEALAHCRPVVTTSVSGIPELVRDGETGRLVPPGNVEALTRAIEEVRADPDAARHMAEQGRRVVEEEFDLRKNAGRQLTLFEKHSRGRAARHDPSQRRRRTREVPVVGLLVWLVLGASLGPSAALAASEPPISHVLESGDRLRVTVHNWPDLSGEFTIGPDGTISLPMIGEVPAGGTTTGEVAQMVAEKYAARLQIEPRVNVDVAEYRPYYVLGAVANPGRYTYQPGLTVLQAVAEAGGYYRIASGSVSGEQLAIRAIETLGLLDTERTALLARQSRLTAERVGAEEIAFPPSLLERRNEPAVNALLDGEGHLFQSRRRDLEEQIQLLGSQKIHYEEEIQNLTGQMAAKRKEKALVERELGNSEKLNEQGYATLSSVLSLQREAAAIEGERLEIASYIARARQRIGQVEQELLTLQNERRLEVLMELQEVESSLATIPARMLAAQNLAGTIDAEAPSESISMSHQFTIVRQHADQTTRLSAAEDARLLPGDVLQVGIGTPGTMPQASSAALD